MGKTLEKVFSQIGLLAPFFITKMHGLFSSPTLFFVVPSSRGGGGGCRPSLEE